ncbi:aldehyde dehydrogenase family protein [Streptomyces sp. NBC_01102]|uniref:aldehyde dehydrogenase family protein n=1 Tax=Streptomyces sp. NBC_01102 TaxID=2903749 RepID=UPI003868466B|nr:aldehyde dehydrogenase family protein [Streptomyces sp. NBC_01102]
MTTETGGTRIWAAFNIHMSATLIRQAATMATSPTGSVLATDVPGEWSMAVREPAGVVAAFVPWNGPLILCARAIAVALATGNPVVIRPSEDGPITSGYFLTYGCTALATRPPGAMMFILVCTLGTVLPGRSLAEVVATAATGATAAALTATGTRRSERTMALPLLTDTHRARLARARWSLNPKASPLVFMAARSTFAVALAGSTAVAAGAERPYWAMAAAAAVLGRGNQAATAILRAGQRMTGTLVGCLLLLAHPRDLVAALVLAALTFGTELFVARNYALAMVFVTPMALLLTDSAGPAMPVGPLLASRAGETLLGCAAAVAVSQVVTRRWAVRHHQAMQAVVRLTERAHSGAPNSREAQERAGRLAGAVYRLETVAARTSAERRGIRTATEELRALSGQTLTHARTLLNDPGQRPGPPSLPEKAPAPGPGPAPESRPT